MNFSDVINSSIEARHAKVAYILVGTITDYEPITHTATVRCTSRTGNGFIDYQLPWITESPGIYNPAPVIDTHVIIGFRMGDPESPLIIGRYDPWYKTITRENAKRNIETIATRTVGNILG